MIMKISTYDIYSWYTIIFDIIRLFTSQDVDIFKLKNFILKIRNKRSTVITIISLIFFTVIITKCFTSLLLSTYFKLIKVSYVESLEQLMDGNQCLIASMNRSLRLLKDFNVFEEKQIEVLRKRKKEYQDIVKIDMDDKGAVYDERVFNDVIEGKTILLENTFGINNFIEIYKRDRDRFVISEHKYINLLAGPPINKESFIKEKQIFGFVSSILTFNRLNLN